jgi:hypothetical protein
MYIFVHKYIIPSSKAFEILKISLATQIMLASQFVDFLSTLDVSRIITSLTWDVKMDSKNLEHTSVTVDILFKY